MSNPNEIFSMSQEVDIIGLTSGRFAVMPARVIVLRSAADLFCFVEHHSTDCRRACLA
jgi:hypothetical protein